MCAWTVLRLSAGVVVPLCLLSLPYIINEWIITLSPFVRTSFNIYAILHNLNKLITRSNNLLLLLLGVSVHSSSPRTNWPKICILFSSCIALAFCPRFLKSMCVQPDLCAAALVNHGFVWSVGCAGEGRGWESESAGSCIRSHNSREGHTGMTCELSLIGSHPLLLTRCLATQSRCTKAEVSCYPH